MQVQAPTYRKQKRKGKPVLAFVEINGDRRYLGEFNSAESHQRYEAFTAEWKASGHIPPTNADDLRIVELVDRYIVGPALVHAKVPEYLAISLHRSGGSYFFLKIPIDIPNQRSKVWGHVARWVRKSWIGCLSSVLRF